MIAGLEKIDEGEIFINDQKINDFHPSKRQTAMVFQSYALYPHMNVYENMSFGLKIEKKSKEEIETKVMQAAKILKIEELLERKPKQIFSELAQSPTSKKRETAAHKRLNTQGAGELCR